MTSVRKTDDKNQIFIVCLYLTTFFRANIEPWKGLIPIYSTFLLYRRYYGSGLFILFLLIPYVNIWFSFGLMYRMAKSFGKDMYWFIFLMVLLNPIGELILAFGTTKYNKYSLDLNKKEVA